MSKYTKQEVSEALSRLREWIKEGETIYTIVRNVSRSGMSRDISVVLFVPATADCPEHTLHPNHAVSRVLGDRLVTVHGNDAIKVNGCGMDMAWDLVYRLSWALFGRGDALTQRGL